MSVYTSLFISLCLNACVSLYSLIPLILLNRVVWFILLFELSLCNGNGFGLSVRVKLSTTTCQPKIMRHGIMPLKNMIHDTRLHKSWTITRNGTIHQLLFRIQVKTMSLQKNILNWIFISANVKPKYRIFEANSFTVYYKIPFPSLHVQQAHLIYVILYS